MQIQLNSSILRKVFDKLVVIKSNVVLPITEYTLVSVDQDNVSFMSTDLERYLEVKIPFQGLGLEPFSFLVPTIMFHQTVKNLPEEMVTITFNNETLSVELKAKTGKYKMSGESKHDFPEFKDEVSENSFKVKSSVFCDGIDKVAPYASKDTIRLALSAMKIDVLNDKIVLVATDAHVMSMYTIPGEDQGVYSAVVPAKAVKDLSSFIESDSEEITVIIYQNRVLFQSEYVKYQVVLVDAKYPPYETIIPKNDKTVIFKKSDLVGSLKRLNIYSSNIKRGVFNFGDDEVLLTSEDIDFSRNASERLTVTYGEGNLDQFQIGFNITFLIELLKKHDTEDIVLSFSTPQTAMTIKELASSEIENFSVMMPLLVTDSL